MVAEAREGFARRLSEALDHAGVPSGRSRASAVARMFGVSRESVRKWLAGEGVPKTTRIAEMAVELGVSAEYLLTGRTETADPTHGPHLRPPPRRPPPGTHRFHPHSGRLTPQLLALEALEEEATPRTQDLIRKLVTKIKNNELSEEDARLIGEILDRF